LTDKGDTGLRARHAIALAVREDFGRLFAILVRDVRNFHLAEDCLQDAMESAVVHWARSGVPASPQGWLLQAARRKAIDRLRRQRSFGMKSEEYGRLIELDQTTEEAPVIEDERLRLIFTCCHPALDEKTRIALTLRTLCGLTTPEIARAFVDSEEAMAQRLVRAKHKIEKAGIPYEIPDADALPGRLESVRIVIYLVFNEGYAATAGASHTRIDLCDEAIRLARLLNDLQPQDPETEGLLAMMLLNHARHIARRGATGEIVPLEHQDRSLWDRAMIAEGTDLVQQALHRRKPAPYQMQAAISAIHAEAIRHDDTRWDEIVLIYDQLFKHTGNPVHRLNGAVAVSFLKGPQAGLDALLPLAADLGSYQSYFAAKADMQRRAGDHAAARESYEEAIQLSHNQRERDFLRQRRDGLTSCNVII
jgi:RNA polymerase sigma-70 factor, ECF subfamily